MTAHTCHAHGCETRCRPSLFMCPPHWRMVPAPIKALIAATYQPGQEQIFVDDNAPWPSQGYLDAAHAAVDAVAALEAPE